MKTLVTGGLGFIGSHICIELLSEGIDVVVIDNLENSSIGTKDIIEKISNKTITFYEETLLDYEKIDEILKNENVDSIIHCAGHKAVGESIREPLKYYRENITMTLHLLELVNKHNINTFIFSSSATVYGNKSKIFTEDDVVGQNITNPYGQTKYMQEVILRDFFRVNNDKKLVILRYFNPVGCHSSGLLGEDPNDIPNNLMPYVMRVASNNYKLGFPQEQYNKLTIFGNDYDTHDGTCIRDFIHVVDLAKSHVVALYYNGTSNIDIFNIGTGTGTSVLELVNTFERINNISLQYEFGERRDGDICTVVCDTTKANAVLGWKSSLTIEDVVRDNWNYISSKATNM
jgi:UDP-glucose 4-epimerase